MSDLRFDGRVAVVTGAGRGLGRVYAVELARRGASVVVNDLPGGSVADAVAEITAAGGRAVAAEQALGTAEAALDIVRAALDAFGRVDVLINNAAMAANPDIEATLQVDLIGGMHLVQAVWPHLVEQRYGRILNTTSNLALFGVAPATGRDPYAAAKGGMVGLTKNLAAVGVEHGIAVNAIAPIAGTPRAARMPAIYQDWIRTYYPPEQVAPTATWLCHQDCPATGQIFSVGAGRVARVFFAETNGFARKDHTAEDVRDNFAVVLDESGYHTPNTATDEYEIFSAMLDIPMPGQP